MSARLRDEFLGAGTGTTVHVMLGEAHDFYLHDPTNLAQYAGTVSFQAKVGFGCLVPTTVPMPLPSIHPLIIHSWLPGRQLRRLPRLAAFNYALNFARDLVLAPCGGELAMRPVSEGRKLENAKMYIKQNPIVQGAKQHSAVPRPNVFGRGVAERQRDGPSDPGRLPGPRRGPAVECN
jgi:hypothetical protein